MLCTLGREKHNIWKTYRICIDSNGCVTLIKVFEWCSIAGQTQMRAVQVESGTFRDWKWDTPIGLNQMKKKLLIHIPSHWKRAKTGLRSRFYSFQFLVVYH